jgi:rhamnose ABC transporter rhamnose-binding protein
MLPKASVSLYNEVWEGLAMNATRLCKPKGLLAVGMLLALVFVSGCTYRSADSAFKVIYNNEPKTKASVHSGETAAPKKYKVALVSKIATIPYFSVTEDGAKEAANDLGIELISAGPQIADAGHQIETVETLIEQRVDAIAVAANDPAALVPVLQKARQRGIEVITWDSDTLPEARTFFVNQVDAETYGRHQMDLLASVLNERGSFAILTGSTTAMNLNEWVKWIKVQREEYYPKMELVDIVANDEDQQKAYTLALELLDRHPGLKGIIGIGSISPPGAAKAVQERGLAGKVKVIGVSTPTIMRPYLQEGSAQVITLWSPKKLGYLTVYLAKQLLDAKMPYDGQKIPNVGSIRVKGDVVIMGEPLDFTKDNVDEYDF